MAEVISHIATALTLTSSQSPKGDGIPTPLQSGVSLNRTAISGRSRFRGLIHSKLSFTLPRFRLFGIALKPCCGYSCFHP